MLLSHLDYLDEVLTDIRSCKSCYEIEDSTFVINPQGYCSKCYTEKGKAEFKLEQEKRVSKRAHEFRIKYRMTKEDFYEMLFMQDHKCDICKKPAHELSRGLCIDHDHTTGVIRGLLCTQCNTGLGMFKDNPDFLTEACFYLYKNKLAKVEILEK